MSIADQVAIENLKNDVAELKKAPWSVLDELVNRVRATEEELKSLKDKYTMLNARMGK